MKTEIKEKAKRIFGNNKNVKELFVNPKGEFFTNENLAMNSVKGKKDDLEVAKRSDFVKEDEKKSPEMPKELLELRGKELENYLSTLKRNELMEIAPIIGYQIKGFMKNEAIVKEIVKILNEE